MNVLNNTHLQLTIASMKVTLLKKYEGSGKIIIS